MIQDSYERFSQKPMGQEREIGQNSGFNSML